MEWRELSSRLMWANMRWGGDIWVFLVHMVMRVKEMRKMLGVLGKLTECADSVGKSG